MMYPIFFHPIERIFIVKNPNSQSLPASTIQKNSMAFRIFAKFFSKNKLFRTVCNVFVTVSVLKYRQRSRFGAKQSFFRRDEGDI